MSEYADLDPVGEPVGLAVLLPGRGYTARMPLLHFTAGVVRDRGWRVRRVRWKPPQAASVDLVGDELAAAVGDHSGPVLVIGKSLGSCAAPYAARRSWPAIWLTPLLQLDPVLAGIRANQAEQLLVGGTVDTLAGWDPELTESLPADVVEVAGADHALEIPGDAVASAAALGDVMAAIDGWMDETRLV